MSTQITYEEIQDDAEELFRALGGTGSKYARIVDRMRRVIAAYALTSNLSTEYVIRMSQDVNVLAMDINKKVFVV